MGIKVTVCELHNEPAAFASDWKQLVSHVNGEASHLVVLPEMPFYPWFATTSRFDLPTWQAAVTSHDRWEERLQELTAALVLSSRPINRGKLRLNEGFLWESQQGYRPIHQKYYLPNEEAYWEASWYQRGNGDFVPVTQGGVQLGMLICSDLGGRNVAVVIENRLWLGKLMVEPPGGFRPQEEVLVNEGRGLHAISLKRPGAKCD